MDQCGHGEMTDRVGSGCNEISNSARLCYDMLLVVMEDVRRVSYVGVKNSQEASARVRNINLKVLNS